MVKNIVIFSDGTGQAGGLRPDERRSNVYKLYRASRVDIESSIDPKKQHAFYDPGLGSKADGGYQWLSETFQSIYNVFSQATGLGITKNIIDCYSEIIRVYEPGDRIYLFGFSRGAYTIRCLSGVLRLCGVPTTDGEGKPLKKDRKSLRKLARFAVRSVYQHGNGRQASSRYGDLMAQRSKFSDQFRNQYSSQEVSAYFIGVWDTVASVGVRWLILLMFALSVVGLSLFAASSFRETLSFFSLEFAFWQVLTVLVAGFSISTFTFWILSIFRWPKIGGIPWWKTLHFTGWRMRFFDNKLDQRVQYAKHALSIDEHRKDFSRATWNPSDVTERHYGHDWFEQVWFSGNHSDIGGGYLENESRLSDITFKWMVEKATEIEHPILVDKKFLNYNPDTSGMQHDEIKASILPWATKIRKIPQDAPLHASVIKRFKKKHVLHFDEEKPYRPSNLEWHNDVKPFYD